METIGDRIRAARIARGVLQADLAQLAGVRETQLSRWETGAKTPTVESLGKVATALGVPLGALAGSEPMPSADPATPADPQPPAA